MTRSVIDAIRKVGYLDPFQKRSFPGVVEADDQDGEFGGCKVGLVDPRCQAEHAFTDAQRGN